MESVPDMDERRMATARLVKHLQKQALKEKFSTLAESVGLPALEGAKTDFFKDFGTDIPTLSRLIDDGHFFTDSTLSS